MEEVLRTTFAPGGDGFDAWGGALGRWLAPVRVTPRVTHPAEATLTVTHFGYLSLLAAEAGPMRLSRTARLIAGPEAPASRTAARRDAAVGPMTRADAVAVVLQEAGDGALTQDGRSTALRAGDTAVVDLRRPFCLEQRSSFRALLLRVPEHALGIPADRLERVTARVAAPGGAGLLAPYLSGLAAAVVHIPPRAGDLLAGTTVEFVATLADELAGDDDRPRGGARDHLVPRIRRYIDHNLGDADLAPGRIAAAHHISVRYMHRLFEGEELTVGQLIQRRRVEECARELSRRGRARPSISAVAMRWGFPSPTHFSRTFKAVYGVSPRRWRPAGTAQLPVPARDCSQTTYCAD